KKLRDRNEGLRVERQEKKVFEIENKVLKASKEELELKIPELKTAVSHVFRTKEAVHYRIIEAKRVND
ncbi:13562_t:CDS:1, partial [Funneliformis geosporum]